MSVHSQIEDRICHHVNALERLLGCQVLMLAIVLPDTPSELIVSHLSPARGELSGAELGPVAFVLPGDPSPEIRDLLFGVVGDALHNASKSL
jgi:hypothetical protein